MQVHDNSITEDISSSDCRMGIFIHAYLDQFYMNVKIYFSHGCIEDTFGIKTRHKGVCRCDVITRLEVKQVGEGLSATNDCEDEHAQTRKHRVENNHIYQMVAW